MRMPSKEKSKGDARAEFPWYKPEAYAGASGMSALDWSLLLSYRRAALNSTGKQLALSYAAIKQNPLAIRCLPTPHPAIRETNFVEWREISELHDCLPIKKKVDKWLARYGHVHPTRYWAGVYFAGYPRLMSLHEFLLRYSRKKHQLPEDLEQAFDFKLRSTVVSVDLDMPDDYLVALFSSWLKLKRDALKSSGYAFQPKVARKKAKLKRFTRADLKRWAEKRVLDYLDIRIACRADGKKVPSDPVLSALLPVSHKRGVDENDVIKKQTKKYAIDLLKIEVIRLLEQQGILEFMDGKSFGKQNSK